MNQSKTNVIILFLSLGVLAIFLFSSRLGTVEISWLSFREALFHYNPENLASVLIWDVRIPRFLLAVLAGGALATAGQAMQILVRNPLADPYTMGTASGAALFINLGLLNWLPLFFTSIYFLPVWGFAGALLSSFLVLLLVSGAKRVENTTILLVGVAISILANSLLSLLTFWASRQFEVRQMLYWTFGNLDKANWQSVGIASALILIGFLALYFNSGTWNLILLGDDKAASLGVNVRSSKRNLLLISSLLTATVVCFVGPIGFVGLVVPYWVRHLRPITHRSFWPLTFLVGAVFLSLCDLVSRIVFQPFGLPIGLITSLVGVPFFLYLLRDSGRRASF